MSRRDRGRIRCRGPWRRSRKSASGADLRVVERNLEVKTPDGGTCDAAFIHPDGGAYPGVLIWPDSLGLRPALRELGRRDRGRRYSALVPNPRYATGPRASARVSRRVSIRPTALEDLKEYQRHVTPFDAPRRCRKETRLRLSRSSTRSPK